MSQFKIGDKVRRNDFVDDEEDGNEISTGSIGTVTHYEPGLYTRQPYKVRFDCGTHWWIRGECLSMLEPRTKETIEKEVITKIKYLNEKYAKSRTIPPQVVDAEQRELGTCTTSTGREAPRITTITTGFRHPDYIVANAIRSETTRLRGIDAEYEIVRYRELTRLLDEYSTF